MNCLIQLFENSNVNNRFRNSLIETNGYRFLNWHRFLIGRIIGGCKRVAMQRYLTE